MKDDNDSGQQPKSGSVRRSLLCVVTGCGAYMAVDAQARYVVDVMPMIVALTASIVPSAAKVLVSRRWAL